MKKNLPYHKYNFILSVIGFIGSLTFYFGVLKEISVKENPTEKKQLERLEMEIQQLRKDIEDC